MWAACHVFAFMHRHHLSLASYRLISRDAHTHTHTENHLFTNMHNIKSNCIFVYKLNIYCTIFFQCTYFSMHRKFIFHLTTRTYSRINWMRNHEVYAYAATDLNKVNESSARQETCSLVMASVAVSELLRKYRMYRNLQHFSFWHILSLWTVSLYGNLLCIISVPSHNIQ